MNKKILAISISGVLALAVIATTINVQGAGESTPSSGILRKVFELLVRHDQNTGLEHQAIIKELDFKKRFYQLVFNTPIEVTGNGGADLFAKVEVDSCKKALSDLNACAFNVESMLIEVDPLSIAPGENATVTAIVVDGVPTAIQEATITASHPKANVMLDGVVSGPEHHGLTTIGASDSVEIQIDVTGTITFTKIEFNGEQPDGMHLQLQVTTP